MILCHESLGRTNAVKHCWNELKGSSFDRVAIKGAMAAYAHPLGLKTRTSFLADVNYNDGLANEVQSWDYDAAGNRMYASANTGTWAYDNQNRRCICKVLIGQ